MLAMRSLVPPLTILALTALAALPWGIGSDYRFILPHLVYAAIHYFTLRHERQVPELVVFVSGLTLDVVTGGPLGYWSFVFLAGYAIAVIQAPHARAGRRARWGLTIVALLALAAIEWTVASLYYLELADWRPIALAATAVGLAYPALALVFHGLDSTREHKVPGWS